MTDAKKAAEIPQIVRGVTLDVNLFKEQSLADELIKKYDQNSHETMTSTHSIEKETKSEISYDSSGDHLNNEKDSENLNGAKYWKSGVANDVSLFFCFNICRNFNFVFLSVLFITFFTRLMKILALFQNFGGMTSFALL